RKEIAQLLEALVAKHPTGTIYVAWDNASMHEDEEIEDVVRAAAGRLVLLYLPTYSPWLNPIEMLWRYFRGEVTHCELFETKPALLAAAKACFERFNQCEDEDPFRHRLESRKSCLNVLSRWLVRLDRQARNGADPAINNQVALSLNFSALRP